MGLVHKLLQPSLGSDGDDDGLFEKGILKKKCSEKFKFMPEGVFDLTT